MKYGIYYINRHEDFENLESGTFSFLKMMWDYETRGEIVITHIEVSEDNWETSWTMFHRKGF